MVKMWRNIRIFLGIKLFWGKFIDCSLLVFDGKKWGNISITRMKILV